MKELKEKELIRSDEHKIYTLTEKGEKELVSALRYFSQIFFDVEEMFKCCTPNQESGKDQNKEE